MKEEELKKLVEEKKKIEWDESKEGKEHLRTLDYVKDLIPKPKGVFVKKCPICKSKLMKPIKKRYYRCECGYEYYDLEYVTILDYLTL